MPAFFSSDRHPIRSTDFTKRVRNSLSHSLRQWGWRFTQAADFLETSSRLRPSLASFACPDKHLEENHLSFSPSNVGSTTVGPTMTTTAFSDGSTAVRTASPSSTCTTTSSGASSSDLLIPSSPLIPFSSLSISPFRYRVEDDSSLFSASSFSGVWWAWLLGTSPFSAAWPIPKGLYAALVYCVLPWLWYLPRIPPAAVVFSSNSIVEAEVEKGKKREKRSALHEDEEDRRNSKATMIPRNCSLVSQAKEENIPMAVGLQAVQFFIERGRSMYSDDGPNGPHATVETPFSSSLSAFSVQKKEEWENSTSKRWSGYQGLSLPMQQGFLSLLSSALSFQEQALGISEQQEKVFYTQCAERLLQEMEQLQADAWFYQHAQKGNQEKECDGDSSLCSSSKSPSPFPIRAKVHHRLREAGWISTCNEVEQRVVYTIEETLSTPLHSTAPLPLGEERRRTHSCPLKAVKDETKEKEEERRIQKLEGKVEERPSISRSLISLAYEEEQSALTHFFVGACVPSVYFAPPSTAALEAVLTNWFLSVLYCPSRFMWGGEREEEMSKKRSTPYEKHTMKDDATRSDGLSMLWPTSITSPNRTVPTGGKHRATSPHFGTPIALSSPHLIEEKIFAFRPSTISSSSFRATLPAPTGATTTTSRCGPATTVASLRGVGGAVFQPSTFHTYFTLFSISFRQSLFRCCATFRQGKPILENSASGSGLEERQGRRLVVYGNEHTFTPTAMHAARLAGYEHFRLLPATSHPTTGNISFSLEVFQSFVAEDLALGRVPSVWCGSILQGPTALVDDVGAVTRFCQQVGIWTHLVMTSEETSAASGNALDGTTGVATHGLYNASRTSTTIPKRGCGSSAVALLRYMKEVEKEHRTDDESNQNGDVLPRVMQPLYQHAMSQCRAALHEADSFQLSLVDGDDDDDVHVAHQRMEGDTSKPFAMPELDGCFSSSPLFSSLPHRTREGSKSSVAAQVLGIDAVRHLGLPKDFTLLALADIRKLYATADACGWGSARPSFSSTFASSCVFSRFSTPPPPPSFPSSSVVESSAASTSEMGSFPASPLSSFPVLMLPNVRSHWGAVSPALLHAMATAVLLHCSAGITQEKTWESMSSTEATSKEAAKRCHDMMESFKDWQSVLCGLWDHFVKEGKFEIRPQSLLAGRLVFRWRMLSDESNLALCQAIQEECAARNGSCSSSTSTPACLLGENGKRKAGDGRITKDHDPRTSTPLEMAKHITKSEKWNGTREELLSTTKFTIPIPVYCSVVSIERRLWISLRYGGMDFSCFQRVWKDFHSKEDEPLRHKCSSKASTKEEGVVSSHVSAASVRRTSSPESCERAAMKYREQFRKKCVEELWRPLQRALERF